MFLNVIRSDESHVSLHLVSSSPSLSSLVSVPFLLVLFWESRVLTRVSRSRVDVSRVILMLKVFFPFGLPLPVLSSSSCFPSWFAFLSSRCVYFERLVALVVFDDSRSLFALLLCMLWLFFFGNFYCKNLISFVFSWKILSWASSFFFLFLFKNRVLVFICL